MHENERERGVYRVKRERKKDKVVEVDWER